MREHRVIDKMVENLRKELGLVKVGELNTSFINSAVDFLRTYADRMHHGKEEDILFRDLVKKNLSVELRKIMDELVQEHIIARIAVKDLFESNERYVKGEKGALSTVELNLSKLVELYPMHIEKEDKRFFYPVMNFFSPHEQQEMLKEFYDFDRKINHKNYGGLTEHVRSGASEVNLMRCTVCGYIYDPSKGDPEHGVNANTSWEDLPADWVCPICFAPKTMFEKYGGV